MFLQIIKVSWCEVKKKMENYCYEGKDGYKELYLGLILLVSTRHFTCERVTLAKSVLQALVTYIIDLSRDRKETHIRLTIFILIYTNPTSTPFQIQTSPTTNQKAHHNKCLNSEQQREREENTLKISTEFTEKE